MELSDFFNVIAEEMARGNFSFAILISSILQLLVMMVNLTFVIIGTVISIKTYRRIKRSNEKRATKKLDG